VADQLWGLFASRLPSKDKDKGNGTGKEAREGRHA